MCHPQIFLFAISFTNDVKPGTVQLIQSKKQDNPIISIDSPVKKTCHEANPVIPIDSPVKKTDHEANPVMPIDSPVKKTSQKPGD